MVTTKRTKTRSSSATLPSAAAPKPPAPTPIPQPGGVEDLGAIAGEIDAERSQGAQKQQQQAADQAKLENVSANQARAAMAAEIVQVLRPVRDIAEETLSELDALPAGKFTEIWADKKLEAIAQPLVIVIERHGEAFAKLMTDWMPYVSLAAATLMPSIATMKAMRAHRPIATAAREVKQGEGGQGGGQQQPA